MLSRLGPLGLRHGFGLANDREDFFHDSHVARLMKTAQHLQVRSARRPPAGDLDHDVVAHHGADGAVLFARPLISPLDKPFERHEGERIEPAGAFELPEPLTAGRPIHLRILEANELLICPVSSFAVREAALQLGAYPRQIHYVVSRVLELLFGQRAPQPIGQRLTLRDLTTGHLIHQANEIERIAVSEEAGGDLHVKHVARRQTA